MHEFTISPPSIAKEIMKEVKEVGFTMNCDYETGSLLRTLAATKRNGRFLELGTGAGFSTSWILEGMDKHSTLITNEIDGDLHRIAKNYLSSDSRVEFVTGDGGELIKSLHRQTFDFIFADTWPGKLSLLEETLALLKEGGLYVIDDLLPQEDWPIEHHEKIIKLINVIESNSNLAITKLNWSTGLIIATKVS
ncbi:O-methyltransferase [Shouchella patagoniensis]|uniref:O-methyltransferase n=1 Tax=Shouchella patagoniensis TaxID=228576 RepID=UPI000994F268|nr:class I SAM-dependent methyltransferase [Shouchella patagoniensis]